MKQDKYIDKLFREGTQKHYPYDAELWNKIEEELPSDGKSPASKSKWTNTFKLLVVLPIILFLETDYIASSNQQKQVSNYSILRPSTSTVSDEKTVMPSEEDNKPEIKPSYKIAKQHEIALPMRSLQEHSTTFKQSSHSKEEKNINHALGQSDLQSGKAGSESGRTKIILLAEQDDTDEKITVDPNALVFHPHIEEEHTSYPTDGMRKLSLLGLQYFSYNNNLSPIEKNNLDELQQKVDKRELYIEIEMGRSFWIDKKLSGLEANQHTYRQKAESSSYQQWMGLNVLTDNKHINFGLGIHMRNIYEKLSYSYNEEISSFDITYDTSYTIVNGNFSSNGTPVILIKENIIGNSIEVIENVDRELIASNHFKRISLPFSLSYTKSIGRFSGGIRTALILDYLYASSGGYISNNRRAFYGFGEKQQLEQWIIGNRNQLRFGYLLNEFVYIGTSLNHQQDLSSFTTNYSSKFNSFGLGLWLIYKPN